MLVVQREIRRRTFFMCSGIILQIIGMNPIVATGQLREIVIGVIENELSSTINQRSEWTVVKRAPTSDRVRPVLRSVDIWLWREIPVEEFRITTEVRMDRRCRTRPTNDGHRVYAMVSVRRECRSVHRSPMSVREDLHRQFNTSQRISYHKARCVVQ